MREEKEKANANNTKLASLQSEIKQKSNIQNKLNSQLASVYAHMREEKEKANENNPKLASLQSEIKQKSNIQNNLNSQLANVYAHMREEKEKTKEVDTKLAKAIETKLENLQSVSEQKSKRIFELKLQVSHYPLKEQREIQTEHEEEMLKGICFSQLREAKERLKSNRISRVSRPPMPEEAEIRDRSDAQPLVSPPEATQRPTDLPFLLPLRTSFDENTQKSLLARWLSSRMAQEAVDRVAVREAARNERPQGGLERFFAASVKGMSNLFCLS
jgi:hypothetical protein